MSTIVVGVDGSGGSVVALRWALEEARVRGSSVRVVHAYQALHVPAAESGFVAAGGMGMPGVLTEDSQQLRDAAEREARALIDQTLRDAHGGGNGPEVERTPIEGPAAQTLIETARGAELLVVGSRGHGGFLGLLLGSVSQQCAQHPPCPVVIVPHEEKPDG